MKTSSLSVIHLALGAALTAQGGTVPPGYDSTEGTDYTYLLGYYQEMHAQITSADLTGKGRKTMKEISFRQDGSVYSSSAIDRSWANVRIDMCESRFASLSTTWTANFLTSPTQVFSAMHSWPSLTAKPAGSPQPWDNGGLKFPLSTNYVYTGTNDLLLDMEFSGGVLGNAAPWGPASSNGKAYFLDGKTVATTQQGSVYVYGLTTACTFDSNVTPNTTGAGYGYFVAHADNTPSRQFRYWTFRTYLPNSTSFIHALAMGGTSSTTSPGPIAGLGCQALQIDLTKLLLTQAFTTGTTGHYRQPTQYAPFAPAVVGMEIWAQGIWDDTATKQPKLTRTSRCIIPALPPPADFRGKFAYFYNSKSTTSFPPQRSYVPLFRYQ